MMPTPPHEPALQADIPLPEIGPLLDVLPDGFQAFDRDWRYIFMNRRAEQILGRKREELLGRICWEEYPEAVGTPFHQTYTRAMDTGEPTSFEFFCPHEQTWMEIALQPFSDGLVAWQRDISGRQRAEERAAHLQAVTAAFAGSLTPLQVADVMVRQGAEALGARAGLVALAVGPASEELEVVRAAGYATLTLEGWYRFRVDGPYPASEAVRTNCPIFLEDGKAFAERYPELAHQINKNNEAGAALPLTVEGRTFGVVYLTFPGPRSFTEADKEFFLTFSSQCAQALERARLYGAQEQAAARADRLLALSDALAEALTREQVADVVVAHTAPILEAEIAVVVVLENDGTQLRKLSTRGYSPAAASKWHTFSADPRFPLPDAVLNRTLVVLETPEEAEMRYPLLRELTAEAGGAGAAIAAPLIAQGGQVIGGMSLRFAQPRRIGEEDRAFIMTAAGQCALALERARLFEEAHEEIERRKRAEQEQERVQRERETILEENARLLKAAAEAAEQQRRFLKDVLSSVTEGRLILCDTEADLPESLCEPIDAASVPLYDEFNLRPLRQVAEQAAAACGLPPHRRQDLLTAVSEAAMNALVHAGGGEAQVCVGSDVGRVQVWLRDRGKGIEFSRLPDAMLRKGYSSAGTLGHGFKLMHASADRVYLLTGPQGTTVVIEQGRTAPEPGWLTSPPSGENHGAFGETSL